MSIKSLALQDFPPLPKTHKEGHPAEFVAVYLSRLAGVHGSVPERPFKIPSLTQLAHFFRCSQMDVYDAFQRLRRQGLDYELLGLDHPITFWRTIAPPHAVSSQPTGGR
jgi:hypothetical protein